MTLPIEALIYTVPILIQVLAQVETHRSWLWYYCVFLAGCAVVWVVRRLWR